MRKLFRTERREAGKEKEADSGRKVYLDVLRLIAIVGVFFNHTGYEGIHHYVETQSSINYWFGIFLASVAQCCVPLFFMITGALLLKKEESVGYVYRHRVLRMVTVTLLAVLFQYYYNYRMNPAIGFDSENYFRILYGGGAIIQQGFLYAYISVLLVLPFLQRMVKALSDKNLFLYAFAAHIVISDVLPILAFYQKWGNTPLELPMFQGAIIYCMMGYYLENRSEDVFYKKKNILLLVLFSILLTAESMHVNHMSIPEKGLVGYGQLFVLVYAAVIFVVVRYLCQRWRMPAALKKLLCFAGGGVFGTYLIERQLQAFYHPVYVFLNTRIRSYPAIFVQIGVSVLTGILIINLVRKVPVMRKLL